MLVYNWFARNKDWHPRIVDTLTIEELEWFPILEEAFSNAEEVISAEMNAQKP